MSPNVPALPTHNTSIRAAPSEASRRTMADTSTSRAMVASPNQSGTAP
jgi:hypothetical protein